MAPAEQNLGRRAGPVHQDQGRGVARLEIGMALVALGLGEALGNVVHLRFLSPAARAFGPDFRTLEPAAPRLPPLPEFIAPFGEDFESQRTGDRRRLDQLHRDGIAQPVALAGVVADQRVARLVVAEVVVADACAPG